MPRHDLNCAHFQIWSMCKVWGADKKIKKRKKVSSPGASRSALCLLNVAKLLRVALMKLCLNPSSCGRGQTGGCHLRNGFDTDSSARSKCALKNACSLIPSYYECWNYSALALGCGGGGQINPANILAFCFHRALFIHPGQISFALVKHYLPIIAQWSH